LTLFNPWLGGRHFSTRAGAALPHVGALSAKWLPGVPPKQTKIAVREVAARSSAETDENCLGRNSQLQLYEAVAIPLFQRNLATMNRIDNSVYQLF